MKKTLLFFIGFIISTSIFSQEEKNEINLDEYGGSFSYGIAIGGGGIIGVPIRIHPTPKFAMEIGAFYRPGVVMSDNSSTTFSSIVIAGGANFYLSKYYKVSKQKIKLNGISLKGGIGFGDFSTYFIGGGWIHESFKERNKNQSFTIELGPGVLVTDNFPAGYYEYDKTKFAIYWKLLWSWYRK